MSEMPCIEEGCEGFVLVGWRLDGEISPCSLCGKEHRVFGDETYNHDTGEC